MEILITREFKKNYKQLSRKYPSLPEDLKEFQSQLLSNPFLGVELAGGFRKIRLSKIKGQRQEWWRKSDYFQLSR